MPSFSEASAEKLATAHPDLQRVFNELIKTVDCTIICGFRNEADQHDAFISGTSRLDWPKSMHNFEPSLAVDAMPCPINWKDIEGIEAFAKQVLACAESLGIKLVWGGSWEKFPDRDHYQLV